MDVSGPGAKMRENKNQSVDEKVVNELSSHHMERLKMESEESCVTQSSDVEVKTQLSEQGRTNRNDENTRSFIGGPSSW